jgi:hypothetical protein
MNEYMNSRFVGGVDCLKILCYRGQDEVHFKIRKKGGARHAKFVNNYKL